MKLVLLFALGGCGPTLRAIELSSTIADNRVVVVARADGAPAPDVPIELALASGATIAGATDEAGVFQCLLAEDDWAAGAVIVRMR